MHRLALLGAIAALLFSYVALRPVPTMGPPMRDFEAYWSAGVIANAGGDPYSRTLWDAERTVPGVDTSHDELLPFVGPAAGLPLWRAIAQVPFAAALWVWGIVLIGAFLIVMLGALALAGFAFEIPAVLAVLLLGGGFGPLTSAVALGQVALVAFAGTIAALLGLRSRLPVLAGAGALLAALQPNVAIVLVARLSDKRALAAILAAFAAFLALMFGAGGGLAGMLAYLSLLLEHARAERFITIQFTPAAVAFGFGASEPVALGLGLASAALAVAATAFVARRTADPVARVALACCAVPFVLTFFHEHDLSIVLLAVVFAVARARGRMLALTAVGTLFAAVDWLGLAQRPSGIAQSAVMATVAALAFAALARREEPARFAGVVVPFIVLAVGTLAAQHAVPTWPDALPLHFEMPPEADAATVWANEQRAAGLAAREPIWASLRAFSLAGCLMLWFAVAAVANQPAGAATRDVSLAVRRRERELGFTTRG